MAKRAPAETEHCEVCERSVLERADAFVPELNRWVQIHRFAGAVDHIVCERLILQLCEGQDPHMRENLMTLCAKCHAIKTAADKLFCEGNVVGFLEKLNANGWDISRVRAAMLLYKFMRIAAVGPATVPL